jgi:hypothetical protein
MEYCFEFNSLLFLPPSIRSAKNFQKVTLIKLVISPLYFILASTLMLYFAGD